MDACTGVSALADWHCHDVVAVIVVGSRGGRKTEKGTKSRPNRPARPAAGKEKGARRRPVQQCAGPGHANRSSRLSAAVLPPRRLPLVLPETAAGPLPVAAMSRPVLCASGAPRPFPP